MDTRTSKVKAYFEDDANYLGSDGRTIGILSRQQIIQSMLKGMHFKNLLDIPCGNGLLSIPLAEQADRLTLVDIAERMIQMAKKNLPEQFANKFDFQKGDIFQMDMPKQSFDCILAIGILAHVDDPSAFIDLMDELLTPGGNLVIQTTDHNHFKIRLQKMLRKGKELSQQDSYTLNNISHKWLTTYFEKKNYRLVKSYRYETKIPLLLSGKGEKGLKGIWKIYGQPPHNRLAFLGSKCLYHYQKNG